MNMENRMGICYIVGAGDFDEAFTPEANDLVIAADGGYDKLMRRGIRCDLCVGDFDSANQPPTECETVTFPVEKDETDMHLAFIEGCKRGYRSFRLYGGTGGRCDHTFANYSLLLYGKERGCDIVLVGGGSEIFVIKNERVTIPERAGAHLSVFAFGGVAEGVTIDGAYYSAKDVTLTQDFPLGVSNSFVGGDVTVEVKQGALLVMLVREKNNFSLFS